MVLSRTGLLVGVAVIIVVLVAGVYVIQRSGPTTTPTTTETTTTFTETRTATSTPTPTPTTTTAKLTIRWGTSSANSQGYISLSTLANLVSRDLPGIEIVPVPTAGAVASMKGFAQGELDACYAADVGFKEMYSFTGRFQDFQSSVKRMPLQTLWVYSMDIGIAVPKEKASQFKCWRDLNNTKIFTLPKGWDVGVALRSALDALGIKYQHVELDLEAVATALQRGDVVATGIYVTSGKSLAPWAQQLIAQMDIAIVNPCPDEVEKLKAAGVPMGESPVKPAFTKDVGVDKMVGTRIYYGFHTGTNIDQETVYKLLKFVEQNAKKLSETDQSFSQLAEDFLGFHVEAINATKYVPLHPGLAMYLKEKGVWNPEWKVGG